MLLTIDRTHLLLPFFNRYLRWALSEMGKISQDMRVVERMCSVLRNVHREKNRAREVLCPFLSNYGCFAKTTTLDSHNTQTILRQLFLQSNVWRAPRGLHEKAVQGSLEKAMGFQLASSVHDKSRISIVTLTAFDDFGGSYLESYKIPDLATLAEKDDECEIPRTVFYRNCVVLWEIVPNAQYKLDVMIFCYHLFHGLILSLW